jgi:hypothetical protein
MCMHVCTHACDAVMMMKLVNSGLNILDVVEDCTIKYAWKMEQISSAFVMSAYSYHIHANVRKFSISIL